MYEMQTHLARISLILIVNILNINLLTKLSLCSSVRLEHRTLNAGVAGSNPVRGILKMITLIPEFFRVAESDELRGKICADCDEEFRENEIAYVPRFKGYWIQKGEYYHESCINKLLNLENIPAKTKNA